MECDICYVKLNEKKAKKQVECEYCQYKCCQTCFQRYLLGITEQKCMSCRRIFTEKFIQSLPKSFVNGELADHRQTIFMMKEQERLKLYEQLVPKYKRRQKDLLQIKKLTADIRKLEFKHKKNNISNKEKEDKQLARIKDKKQTIINNGFRLGANVPVEINNKQVLGPKCPVEKCKGHTITYGVNYKCQMCEADICKRCMTRMSDEEHECNASDVESLRLINKDSKQCPGCGIMIYRESGCPAMFCVNCHVSFNWYSLEIEAPSHNPHYYEWLQQKKYSDLEYYSEEELLLEDHTYLPEYYIFSNSLREYNLPRGSTDFAVECYRLAIEIKDVIPLTKYNQSEIDLLRVKYLTGEIPESKFLERVIIIQKEIDYYSHQHESVTTVYELLKSELWKLTHKECSFDDFAKNSVKILNAYAKDQLETADKYNKKLTLHSISKVAKLLSKFIQTKRSYSGLTVTYLLMSDFEQMMHGEARRQSQILNSGNIYH